MRLSLVNLLAVASTVCAIGTRCGPDEVEGVVESISCGDSAVILECLRKLGDIPMVLEIESCFVIGGCTKEDAASFFQDCNTPESRQGLKKRKEKEVTTTEEEDNETDKPKATKKPAEKPTKTTEEPAKATEEPTKATAKTTAKPTSKVAPKTTPTSKETSTTEESKTSASSTTDSSSSPSSTTPSTTRSTPGTTAAAATTTGKLACSTTKTISTTACSVSGGKTVTCSPTTVVSATCAPGNICFSSSSGSDVCMKRYPPLATSGIVATVFLGLGLVSSIVFIIAMRVMASKKTRRDRAAKLAGGKRPMDDIEEAKPYKIGAGGDGGNDNVPLMPAGGRGNGYTGQDQGYFGQTGGPPSNPFGPSGQPIPQIQLHQGLGALGQDDTHWSQDYNARR
ncbi:uncharacterized protein BP5553_02180 [Venustampulla echinocandica]|uniref:Extracellular membrane protein CFEM domain-containing protein n=1 Tax=Venustampulla echinocandica TaxID=2656787 RepID=A0A370U342_9HELO|nr:uncharacterized protein BP5553_02180 [Venustampulla echinocandica]RDL42201.1 hypothetical protein BP5553_02180 [Venustampulla echinocandica]